MTISTGFSCENGPGEKESPVQTGDDSDTGKTGFSTEGSSHCSAMEIDIEFLPVEHPLEPPDEDRPLKCPIPNSSVVNSGATRSERATEGLRTKRVEVPGGNEDGKMEIIPQPPGLRKRHLAPTPEFAVPGLKLGTCQSSSIFQILQECNEFESS